MDNSRKSTYNIAMMSVQFSLAKNDKEGMFAYKNDLMKELTHGMKIYGRIKEAWFLRTRKHC